jgi:hypothetical protein
VETVIATLTCCFWLVVLTAVALSVTLLPPSRIVDKVTKVVRYFAATAGILVVAALWLIFMPHTPYGVPQEKGRLTLECGEMLLTQVFTATTDPYFVWLYFRPKGETEWTQYFVDFEAPYWWGGLTATETGADLTFYGETVGRFRCNGPTFQLHSRMMDPGHPVSDPFNIAQTQERLPRPFSF